MRSLHTLVVDDEVAIRQVLVSQHSKAGHDVEHVGSGQAAIERLTKGDIEVALCDVRLPDISGIEVIKHSVDAGVDTVFICITAFASISTAIEAMRAGAKDYLIKPIRPQELLHRLAQASEIMGLREENRRLRDLVPEESDAVCTLASAQARRVADLVGKVANTEGTVLITGESGSGKGVTARAIHAQSARASGPFVPVNCGAIPENLLESEFFGHLKGSFTGADRAKKGLMREASGGTLLLDEVAELPLSLQVKLLHAIEEKEVRPVGSEQARKIDVRLIAATNRDLDKRVAEGQFREDLFYRLNVLHIRLPPLRSAREDVRALIRFFLRSLPRKLGLREEYHIDSQAEEALVAYPWPGNVRELRNLMERTLILADSSRIGLDDLPAGVLGQAPAERSAETSFPLPRGTLRECSREFERRVIEAAISEAGGDRQAAAKVLGIGLSTLYRKLEDMGRRSQVL
jgi:two-component system response regulator AtoC